MSAGFWIASIAITMAILAACLLLVLNEAFDACEGAGEEDDND